MLIKCYAHHIYKNILTGTYKKVYISHCTDRPRSGFSWLFSRALRFPSVCVSPKTPAVLTRNRPRAFLFIQILFIILSVIYITCFYYLLTFRREKVYIINALIAAVFPYVFLRSDSWRIPQQRAGHSRCFFFFIHQLKILAS